MSKYPLRHDPTFFFSFSLFIKIRSKPAYLGPEVFKFGLRENKLLLVYQQSKTNKTFKRMLIYYDIDNTMQIFREIPFFRPQNDT